MDVELELVKWFVKERLPTNVLSFHGLIDGSQGYRFYGSYFDLFVETENQDWIIEAEKNAAETTIYKAVGQLLWYKYLWGEYGDKIGKKEIKLICLCPSDCSEDAGKFLKLYDIQFVKGEVIWP